MAKQKTTSEEIKEEIKGKIEEKVKEKGGCKKMDKSCNAVYGLGFIGSAVYFIQHANNFGEGVIGILKAIVWPAFLIHKLLGFLGM